VVPRVIGAVPSGYAIDGPAEVEPDSARVEGPASTVAGLDTVYTLPVDITGEREKIQRQVPLDLGPGSMTAEPRRFLVTIRIARAAAESSGQHP
jgi:hypothetical protein